MYEEERSGLCSFIVKEAPAIFTRNINTSHGAFNGFDAVLHSVTMRDGSESLDTLTDSARMKAYALGHGNVVLKAEIPVPLSVNVIPTVSTEREAKLLKDGASLDAARLVLPIPIGDMPAQQKITSLEGARMCIPSILRPRKHEVDFAFALTDYKVQLSNTSICHLVCVRLGQKEKERS